MKLGCVTNSFFHYTERFSFFFSLKLISCCELSQSEGQRRRWGRKEEESFSGQKTLTWVSSLMCDRQVIKCLVILERATNCQPLRGAWQRKGQQKSQTSLLFPLPRLSRRALNHPPPLRCLCRSEHKYEQTPKAKAFRGTYRRVCSTTINSSAHSKHNDGETLCRKCVSLRYALSKPTVTEPRGAVVTRSPQQELVLFLWENIYRFYSQHLFDNK